MNFPCVQCGICCKIVRIVPGFQHLDNGNGACRYLENNEFEVEKET